jgi:4a-hydroxytetrahydrobiopterin dehydratase
MLTELTCSRIDKSVPPMPLSEAKKLLNEVPGWAMDGPTLVQEFAFKDFIQAMQFVNKVADLANIEDHHPDIRISYNKVRLDLSTHKIGGLSMNDFILAAKIGRI